MSSTAKVYSVAWPLVKSASSPLTNSVTTFAAVVEVSLCMSGRNGLLLRLVKSRSCTRDSLKSVLSPTRPKNTSTDSTQYWFGLTAVSEFVVLGRHKSVRAGT